MRQGLIISSLGEDRPGIVDRVTGLIHESGGNLEDSRMAILGGKFSLMVLVTGPQDALNKLQETLPQEADALGLILQVHETEVDDGNQEIKGPQLAYKLRAVSLDHPGIVHRISHVLANHQVNVAGLETRLSLAPTTGTPIFSLNLEAQVPAELSISKLRDALEKLADEHNLDLELKASDS